LAIALRDETSFAALGESGAAATTQTGVLDSADDRVGLHRRERLARGGIVAAVPVERPRLLAAPVGGQHGGEFHLAVSPRCSASFRPSSVAGPPATPSSARPSGNPAR